MSETVYAKEYQNIDGIKFNSHFNEIDLDLWNDLNKQCWNGTFWEKHIFDIEHFEISINAKRFPDYKMLYDSYLWKKVIQKTGQFSSNINISELLPGKSLTIPVALESLGFKGLLKRIDLEPEHCLSSNFSFKHSWYRNDILDNDFSIKRYKLIIGNHILDDLIYYIHKTKNSEDQKSVFSQIDYTDFNCSKKIWREISKRHNYLYIKSKLGSFVTSISKSLESGSSIILKQYPSTFSLISGDLLSINLQLDFFYSFYECFKAISGIEASFIDTKFIKTAPGSNYPKSFLLIVKK